MTGSSSELRSRPVDPLVREPAKPANWRIVVGLLVGFPLLFAFFLSRWLGMPDERIAPNELFEQLTVPAVETVSLNSLAYGNLLFIRLDLAPQSRGELLRALEGFEVGRGEAEKPVTLELERPWWSPPRAQAGTHWKRGRVTVWNPDNQPDTFYAVVQQSD